MTMTITAQVAHTDWRHASDLDFQDVNAAKAWFDAHTDDLLAFKVAAAADHQPGVIETLDLIRLQTYIDGVLFARRYDRADIEEQVADEWQPWDDSVPATVDPSALFDDVPSDVRYRQAM